MANYADHIAASEAGYVQMFYLQSSVRATFSSFDKLCSNTDTDFIAAQAACLMLHSGTEKKCGHKYSFMFSSELLPSQFYTAGVENQCGVEK